MITLKIKTPEDKESDVLTYIEKNCGEVISIDTTEAETGEDEVTHESFFGENIQRVIRAFKT